MKKSLIFILLILLLVNIFVANKWNIVSAVEADLIWIEKEYGSIGKFSEGLALVSYLEEANYKYGYINELGEEVIPLKYDVAWDFSEGLAAVYFNGKYGYIDKDGKEIIGFEYELAEKFSEGLAAVASSGESGYKWGYIDKSGNEVVPIKHDNGKNFSEGLAVVGLNGKFGYIDSVGNEIIPLKYDLAYDFSEGLSCSFFRWQDWLYR